MVDQVQRTLIRDVLSRVDLLKDVDVSGDEDPACVVSFRTTFGDEAAYDVELTEENSRYEAVLLTSAETPVMRDQIQAIGEEQIDSLFEHVTETLRELEGN